MRERGLECLMSTWICWRGWREGKREKKEKEAAHGEWCLKHNQGLGVRWPEADNKYHNYGNADGTPYNLPTVTVANHVVGLHFFNSHNCPGGRFYYCSCDTVKENGGSWRGSHWFQITQLVRLICLQAVWLQEPKMITITVILYTPRGQYENVRKIQIPM